MFPSLPLVVSFICNLVFLLIVMCQSDMKEYKDKQISNMEKKAVSIDVAEWDEYGNFRWTK